MVPVDLHRPPHIHLSLVHKNLGEPRQVSAQIAEMHPGDFALRGHFGYRIIDFFRTQQLGHAPLAEEHLVVVAGCDLEEGLPELLQRRTYLGDTPQRLGNRRIVGVQRHLHAGFFRRRDHCT